MRILVVDDEALLGGAIARKLAQDGHVCARAETLAQARAALAAGPPELVLLDVRLPDGNGLTLIEDRPKEGGPAFVVLTAFGAIEDAVAAMKLGASDYLKKPIDLDELSVVVAKIAELRALRDRLLLARTRGAPREAPILLGDSPAIGRAREQLRAIAALRGEDGTAPLPTVLILGETGTGKDLAARCLHQWGPRAEQPFVQVDCAVLPKDLMEAELFGHARGAFTGAQQARAGLIEAAEGGSLFLDEIGEVPLDMQAKLLGVIERRRLRRIGSSAETEIGARIVAATNRDLRRMTAERQFREDLFYRLNVLTVEMPPLRARREDIPPLAEHFCDVVARRFGRPRPRWSRAALERLAGHDWPGNVRELRHVVERAVLMSAGGELGVAELGLGSGDGRSGEFGRHLEETSAGDEKRDLLAGLTLDAAERLLIERALAETQGNVSEAARRLGVSRMTLRYRLEKYGFRPPRPPDPDAGG